MMPRVIIVLAAALFTFAVVCWVLSCLPEATNTPEGSLSAEVQHASAVAKLESAIEAWLQVAKEPPNESEPGITPEEKKRRAQVRNLGDRLLKELHEMECERYYSQLEKIANVKEKEWYRRQAVGKLVKSVAGASYSSVRFNHRLGTFTHWSDFSVAQSAYHTAWILNFVRQITDLQERRNFQPELSESIITRVVELFVQAFTEPQLQQDEVDALVTLWATASALAEEHEDLRESWRTILNRVQAPLQRLVKKLPTIKNLERQRLLASVFWTILPDDPGVHTIWQTLAASGQRLLRTIRLPRLREDGTAFPTTCYDLQFLPNEQIAAFTSWSRQTGPERFVCDYHMRLYHAATGYLAHVAPIELVEETRAHGPLARVIQARFCPEAKMLVSIEGCSGGEYKPGIPAKIEFWLVGRDMGHNIVYKHRLPSEYRGWKLACGDASFVTTVATKKLEKVANVAGALPRPAEVLLTTWDVRTGRRLKETQIGLRSGVDQEHCRFVAGKLALLVSEHFDEVFVWDLHSLTELNRVRIADPGKLVVPFPRAVAADASGRYIAAWPGRNGSVTIWTIQDGKEHLTLPITGAGYLEVHPKGDHLVISRLSHGDHSLIEIWSLAREQCVASFSMTRSWLDPSLRFWISRDGRLLATISRSGHEINIWYIGDVR